MGEEQRRDIMMAALERAPSEGFTTQMLDRAAADAGAADDIDWLFPHGVASLLAFHAQWADEAMAARLAAMPLAEMKVRARIRAAVLARLEVLHPHKEAAKRAVAQFALPQHTPLAARLTFATADRMWRATGDRSTDFAWYTKRATLAGVYAATLLRWFTDDTGEITAVFLDARIANVLQSEKLKTRTLQQAETALSQLATLLRRRA